MISLTHLQFRRAKKRLKFETSYPALWAPLSNYIVLAFIAVVLFIMWTQGFKESVLMIPIWIICMYILYNALNLKDKKAEN